MKEKIISKVGFVVTFKDYSYFRGEIRTDRYLPREVLRKKIQAVALGTGKEVDQIFTDHSYDLSNLNMSSREFAN